MREAAGLGGLLFLVAIALFAYAVTTLGVSGGERDFADLLAPFKIQKKVFSSNIQPRSDISKAQICLKMFYLTYFHIC